jgi:DNA-directed RNA polymerase subunit RPC12/RpoP
MKELDYFLNNLSDHELAIFYGYRYLGFLDSSKEKIDTEIQKRNLSREQLKLLLDKKLINDSEEEKIGCERCGSNRLFIETDYKEVPISEFSSAEIAMDSYRCRLCGYNANKAKPKNLFDRIGKVFKKNRQSRINKWNEI